MGTNNPGGPGGAGNAAQPNAQTAPTTATFRVPYSWDRNKPTFDSDDHEDLLTFVDQLDQIISLGKITDDAEKKKCFTEYLPWAKKRAWRNIEAYTNGTYEEFLEEVFKSYPEVRTSEEGSMENLSKICKKYKGVSVTQEGLLRRFGVEFHTVVKKLLSGRALTTNSEACKKYLDTLEASLASTLRLTISSTILLRTQVPGLNPAPVAGQPVKDKRREDPIEIADLIKMAETMAETQTESTQPSGPKETVRSSEYSLVKKESNDERFQELGASIATMQDNMLLSQKENEQRHTELLRQLQQVNKTRDAPPHKDVNLTNTSSNTQTMDRYSSGNSRGERGSDRDCFYCEQTGHFSRECPHKDEHINKGYLTVEGGKHKLGDGKWIPNGPGSQKQRVEDYWRNKSVNQNYYSQGQQVQENFYSSNESERQQDYAETARDEIRSLQVKLARAQQMNQSSLANNTGVVQPTFMAAVQPAAGLIPTPGGIDLTQALHALLLRGLAAGEPQSSQDQFALTRGGANTNGNSAPNF